MSKERDERNEREGKPDDLPEGRSLSPHGGAGRRERDEEGRNGEEEQVTAEVIKLFDNGGYSDFADEAQTVDLVPVEEVLKYAKDYADLKRVVVIGINEEDGLYVAASNPSLSDSIFMMERAKRLLLRYADLSQGV